MEDIRISTNVPDRNPDPGDIGRLEKWYVKAISPLSAPEDRQLLIKIEAELPDGSTSYIVFQTLPERLRAFLDSLERAYQKNVDS